MYPHECRFIVRIPNYCGARSDSIQSFLRLVSPKLQLLSVEATRKDLDFIFAYPSAIDIANAEEEK